MQQVKARIILSYLFWLVCTVGLILEKRTKWKDNGKLTENVVLKRGWLFVLVIRVAHRAAEVLWAQWSIVYLWYNVSNSPTRGNSTISLRFRLPWIYTFLALGRCSAFDGQRIKRIPFMRYILHRNAKPTVSVVINWGITT